MPPRRRLDAELVRRGLARSRDHAAELIEDGRVRVAGMTATKAATSVGLDSAILIDTNSDEPVFVSRGGHKLTGALRAFGPRGLAVSDRLALDAGASTGGFTDVLLRAGVRRVLAVDVGYGQLAWSLRTDQRVATFDRTNVRELTAESLGGERPDLVVADLSFISLTLVLPALQRVATPDADFVLMVKPQFEVGRGRLGKHGVVRAAADRVDAVLGVLAAAERLGLGALGCCASPLPGPAGNVEYFVWLKEGRARVDRARVEAVVESGPGGDGPDTAARSGQDETVDG